MIKTFKKIFKSKSKKASAPRIITAGAHSLQPKKISSGANQIINILSGEGYEAYVVGGCVRDLLLGLRPKDFDVATNATPEQVKSLFKRSRIVGRRFQIVHVRMRSEVIEVTTFRGGHEGTKKRARHESQHSSEGLLLRDNIFGTIDEDAARRDFTVNSLYYHPQDNTIYDYANGQSDLEDRQIRIIGDANVRYREDPVRMLRAIRFSAKLGFAIEPKTAEPIAKQARLLSEIPPARLFDESLKIFMNGYAAASTKLLEEFGLFSVLFPQTAEVIESTVSAQKLLEQALKNTDQRIRTNKRVTPAFIYAAILWPVVCKYQGQYESRGDAPSYALGKAASQAISEQCRVIAIPKRFTQFMREIWELQLRLPMRAGARASRLVEMQRFRAGYDFLLLREQAGELEPGLGQWWTTYQEASPQVRDEMAASVTQHNPKKRRRKRRGPAKKPTSTDA